MRKIIFNIIYYRISPYFIPRKDTDHCGSFNLEMELRHKPEKKTLAIPRMIQDINICSIWPVIPAIFQSFFNSLLKAFQNVSRAGQGNTETIPK